MNEAYENRNHEVEKESFPAPPERTPIRFPAFTPCGEELILTETGHPCGEAPAGNPSRAAEMGSLPGRGDASPDARAGKQTSLVEMISPSDSGSAGGEAPADGADSGDASSPSESGTLGTGTPTTAFVEETTQPTPILPQEGNPEPNPEPSQGQNQGAEVNGTPANAVLNTLRPLLEALCQGLVNAAATPPQWQNPVSAPPPQQQETPAELAARVLSSPEALKAFEEMRMRQAEAVRRSLPILTPSRGQSTSPALAPDLPATMEEAAERARKIFGL